MFSSRAKEVLLTPEAGGGEFCTGGILLSCPSLTLERALSPVSPALTQHPSVAWKSGVPGHCLHPKILGDFLVIQDLNRGVPRR